ncbi:hypothetical protein HPB47_001506 [Ixodes persulcatus]|uniref:Uncharacterized protein n=1 Tax=Ixodes persulcatus TaxID=34615 RepID=A0AC60PPL0_IXOPE|nr:hypothetical protein HPB47_001506 [Ixodes persulcatus]
MLDKLVEPQRIAQMERLTKSLTGRHILQTLNINYEGRLGEKHDIPPDIRGHALKILRTGFHGDRVRGVLIVWAPAHSGLPGNENPPDAARGLTDRADVTNIFNARSSDPGEQVRLVQMAEAAAKEQGLLAAD